MYVHCSLVISRCNIALLSSCKRFIKFMSTYFACEVIISNWMAATNNQSRWLLYALLLFESFEVVKRSVRRPSPLISAA